MINNAIDHSGDTEVGVAVILESGLTRVIVSDDGVGLFNKIQKAVNLPEPRDASMRREVFVDEAKGFCRHSPQVPLEAEPHGDRRFPEFCGDGRGDCHPRCFKR